MKFFCSILLLLLFYTTQAQESDYVPLEDRLKSNIFLKVDVSNSDCFVGEPIIATYKLYSALASESDITKSPTFSGFDIKDLRTEADEVPSRETIDGVAFDVHTILKLQLTPYKPGKLTLGSLTMHNRIKLADANGHKDPILNGVAEAYTLNNGYYNLNISSVPITILVTALPNNTHHVNTDGLVGDFKLNVQLSKSTYAAGEQGQLSITILGTGNFNKIKQPEVEWPTGTTVLPAKVDEDLKQQTGGSGYKSFTIPFIINKPGKYTIPSINFSFFDATSYKYKTITNIPLTFSVIKEGEPVPTIKEKPDNNHLYSILLLGLALIAALFIIFLWIKSVKQKKHRSTTKTEARAAVQKKKAPVSEPSAINIERLLMPAADTIHYTGNTFYVNLKQAVVQFFAERYGLPATAFNAVALKSILAENNIAANVQSRLSDLLAALDRNIYSGGGLDADKEKLLASTKNILQQVM